MIDLGEFSGKFKGELLEKATRFAYQLEQAYAEPEKYAHEIEGLEMNFIAVQTQLDNLQPSPVEQHKDQIRLRIQAKKDEAKARQELLDAKEITPEEAAALAAATSDTLSVSAPQED